MAGPAECLCDESCLTFMTSLDNTIVGAVQAHNNPLLVRCRPTTIAMQ